jgi:hypothetical protein
MEQTQNLKKKILVVCYHAGGANQIINYLIEKKIEYKYYVKGPAVDIFFGQKGKIKKFKKKTVKKFDLVITGSGSSSDLEYKAIKYSKINNKLCITFLDHWTNYKERFVRNRKIHLPNQLFTFDNYSFFLAKKIFKKKLLIKKIKNYYLLNFNKRAKLFKNKSRAILYSSSNYNAVYKKEKDFKILNLFLKKIENMNKFKKLPLHIIIHPSEKLNKYSKYKQLNCVKEIKVLPRDKLINFIKKYKYIVSTNGMSLCAGKVCKLFTINNILNTGIKSFVPKKYINLTI